MKASTKMITIGIISLLVGIGGGIGIGYLISPQSSETIDIRYGAQYYPGEFLLEGKPELFSNYGINVEHRLFVSGGENNAALIAGEVDANCGSDSKTVALFDSIPDKALLIGTIQRGDRYSTIVKEDSSYTSWDDLVGETVGTKLGTGAEQVLRRYFDEPGTPDWEDFTWINLDVTEMASALDSGQIEAFTAWEHTPSVAVDQGIGKVLMSYGGIALTPASIHTTKDFAYSNPGAIVAFLAAHLDKYEMIVNDTANAAQLASDAAAARNTIISAGAFELIYDKINFQIDFDTEIIEAIDDTADFLLNLGKIDSKPDIVWDTRFVEAAKDLQKNFGTPATGLSAESYQIAIDKIVDKHFGATMNNPIVIGLISGVFTLGMAVPVFVSIKRRNN
ncbi:MAG: hypothetical protein GF308_03200 [Candidatus Heimdallarchaeota archaeon]|nr:hypothetical protein [Candidatus Heimdallarchaeota archaeon]